MIPYGHPCWYPWRGAAFFVMCDVLADREWHPTAEVTSAIVDSENADRKTARGILRRSDLSGNVERRGSWAGSPDAPDSRMIRLLLTADEIGELREHWETVTE